VKIVFTAGRVTLFLSLSNTGLNNSALMKYLFDSWGTIVSRIKEARHAMLMFDFDGTLTPIVDTPEIAVLHEQTRKLLKSLTRGHNFTVAIVSGRAINDLQSRVAVSGIIYAGNHGLEIQGPGVSFVHPITDEIKPILRIMGLVLKKTLSTIRGVIVEDKGLTLSVHYRLVDDEKEHEVRSIVENTVGIAERLGKIRTTPGKKVHEVRPNVSWDKGKAVKYLMKRYGKGGRMSKLLPIYLGDDLADEDAFRVVENYGGIAVYIGGENRLSVASYYLSSSGEVDQLIKELLRLN
jgi:trehalose 6-phosphate phosphatase